MISFEINPQQPTIRKKSFSAVLHLEVAFRYLLESLCRETCKNILLSDFGRVTTQF
jgi:hypothetical protein